jgi:murein DD-endopeptidase MepM/ murein hydrolase activator NlpD
MRISAIAVLSTLALSTPALGSNGGTAVPNTASGGVVYGQAVRKVPARPVVRRFAIEHRRVLVRVDRRGARRIGVSMRLRRGQANQLIRRTILTGRRVAIALPALRPGRWTVRLRVTGLRGVRRGRIVVHGVHKAPQLPPPAGGSGVFPVAGWHLYGDGIGAKRKGHRHQGQDIVAAQGTPVVAPLAGTVSFVDFQAHSAGYYVVEHAVDGRDLFFAHCQKGSFAVAPGAAVTAGQRLCLVGRSGDASGPHLHFEIWVGGWRVDKNSQFVDPLPDLRAWDR